MPLSVFISYAKENQATVYVCEGKTCTEPLNSLESIEEYFEENYNVI